MKKIKTKIAYGLTVLSLFAIFGKVTLIKNNTL